MTEPRNVTPGFEPDQDSYPDSGFGQREPKGEAPPEWLAWSWAANRDRSFPWLGLLLVLVGAGLLIQFFVPSLSAGTLILGAIALVFLAGFVFGRSFFALVVGALMGALVVARVIDELNIYTGPGATALSVSVAFLIIWLVGMTRQRRSNWALWGAAIFGLVGFVEVSGRIGSVPELGGAFWPIVIIVVGVILLAGSRRKSRQQPPARY